MKTYIAVADIEAQEMTIQEMIDYAYNEASEYGISKIWEEKDLDDDNAEPLVHSFKNAQGEIITYFRKDVLAEIA